MTRLDRLQRVLIAMIPVLAGSSVVALWAPAAHPRRVAAGPQIVTAKVVRGPTMGGTSVYYQDEPDEMTWTVSGAVTDQRVGLAATGAQWFHDVASGESDPDARDALLAQFTTDVFPGVAVTSSGADSIHFDASGVPGLLWRPSAFGPSASLVIDTSIPSEVETSLAAMVVELQAWSAGQGIEAQTMLSNVVGGLTGSAALNIRSALGVGFVGPAGDIIDLTALAGADYESRASVRLPVSMRSYRAAASGIVTSAAWTSTLEGGGSSQGSVTAP